MRVLQTLALPLGHGTVWSGWRGSNSLPPPWQGGALPDELHPHLVPPVGIEPTTRGFSVRCSTYWATEAYWGSKLPRYANLRFMATPNGLEPSTSSVTGWRANRLHHRAKSDGGNNRARTCDLLLVRQMLSQLSYAPVCLGVLLTSATWFIIHRKPYFVKHFFSKFSDNFW